MELPHENVHMHYHLSPGNTPNHLEVQRKNFTIRISNDRDLLNRDSRDRSNAPIRSSPPILLELERVDDRERVGAR